MFCGSKFMIIVIGACFIIFHTKAAEIEHSVSGIEHVSALAVSTETTFYLDRSDNYVTVELRKISGQVNRIGISVTTPWMAIDISDQIMSRVSKIRFDPIYLSYVPVDADSPIWSFTVSLISASTGDINSIDECNDDINICSVFELGFDRQGLIEAILYEQDSDNVLYERDL
jgi:hypothetical protein